jgi:hypothetical protein
VDDGEPTHAVLAQVGEETRRVELDQLACVSFVGFRLSGFWFGLFELDQLSLECACGLERMHSAWLGHHGRGASGVRREGLEVRFRLSFSGSAGP